MKRIISGALIACILSVGCASSPLQSRLENNFVYQCSTQLLGKGIAASDAEKICSASHKGEMAEQHLAPVRTPAAAQRPVGDAPVGQTPQQTEHPVLQPLPE